MPQLVRTAHYVTSELADTGRLSWTDLAEADAGYTIPRNSTFEAGDVTSGTAEY